MSAPLTLLTTTGERPLAWALCQRWMRGQDYPGAVHWLIVDDGVIPQHRHPMPEGWTWEVIRPRPFWRPGDNTQTRNLLAGLERHGDGPLVIIEDDDWYGPRWLSLCAAALETADLVGMVPARYYQVAARGYWPRFNRQHASLCCTALRGPAVALMRKICERQVSLVDIDLWRLFKGPKRFIKDPQVCGIKGLPGRPGITNAHRSVTYTPDPDGAKLREYVGEEAARVYGALDLPAYDLLPPSVVAPLAPPLRKIKPPLVRHPVRPARLTRATP